MNPSFLDPEIDEFDDEAGYSWDFERNYPLAIEGDEGEEE